MEPHNIFLLWKIKYNTHRIFSAWENIPIGSYQHEKTLKEWSEAQQWKSLRTSRGIGFPFLIIRFYGSTVRITLKFFYLIAPDNLNGE